MQADNASVRTPINRREATSDVKIAASTATNDKRTESNEDGKESRKVAFSKQDRASEETDEKEGATNGMDGDESTGSLTQSDSKGRIVDEDTEPDGMKARMLRDVSDTSRYSNGRKDKVDVTGSYMRRGPSKRKRTHFSGTSNEEGCDINEEKKAADGDKRDSNSEAGRKEAMPDKGTSKNAVGETKSGRNWSVIGTGPSVRNDKTHGKNEGHEVGSGSNWARRYDHVVHQCVGLASAQWCTDTRFTVTLAIGPKGLLGYAGVPSLGRSVLDGTETAIEDRQSTTNKYSVSLKGKRLEWIAEGGGSRYLIVLNPYRKRNGMEVSGVSGLIVELKILQAAA